MNILIVDDDFICRSLLQELLRPWGECRLAASGEEAIAAYDHSLSSGPPFDLICLDIMMPGIDGHQVLNHIRVSEKKRGVAPEDFVKVIMTTALSDTSNIARAFLDGQCEAYLSKPISSTTLFDQLQLLGFAAPDQQ